MKKYYFLLVSVFLLSLAILVFASSKEDIAFPVAELGNCASEEECKAYCDLPENMEPCLDFAEVNNLIPKKNIEMSRKMLTAGKTSGPGGCRGVAECGTYCDDISHIKECLTFAEKNNLMSTDELKEAKKVSAALDRGVQMPPCNSKTECEDVCRLPENMKTCIIFAKEAGLMPPEELEEVEKVLAALEKGITPPPCGGKNECDEYCSEPEHLEECIIFAEAAGFMSADEAAMVRRTGGKGPGDCRGKDECETFCEDPVNMEPCINFAIENGFMSPEEAEQAKKMMAAGFTSGPGGCKGQEECESYCDDISHTTECVDFAEKAGFMSAEDAVRARKMAEMGISGGPGGCKGEEECQSFCEDPANMETCLDFSVQIGDTSPEEAEEMRENMEMMPSEGFEGEMPEGMMPEEFEEQFQQQFQQEFERQTQQQIQQQIQQQTQQQMQQLPPRQEIGVSQEFCLQNPTDPLCLGYKQAPISPEYCVGNPTDPLCQQSFFEQVKNFLAGLIPTL